MTGEKGQVTGKTMVSTNNKNDAGSNNHNQAKTPLDQIVEQIIDKTREKLNSMTPIQILTEYFIKIRGVPDEYAEGMAFSVISSTLGSYVEDEIIPTKYHKPVRPNLYVSVVGPTASSKSIARSEAKKFKKKVMHIYEALKLLHKNPGDILDLYEIERRVARYFVSEGSREGLADHIVENLDEGLDKRLDIVLDEGSNAMESQNTNTYDKRWVNLVLQLYSSDDDITYTYVKRNKRKPRYIPKGFYVNLTIAIQDLRDHFNKKVFKRGLIRRCVILYSDKEKKIKERRKYSNTEEVIDRLSTFLAAMVIMNVLAINMGVLDRLRGIYRREIIRDNNVNLRLLSASDDLAKEYKEFGELYDKNSKIINDLKEQENDERLKDFLDEYTLRINKYLLILLLDRLVENNELYEKIIEKAIRPSLIEAMIKTKVLDNIKWYDNILKAIVDIPSIMTHLMENIKSEITSINTLHKIYEIYHEKREYIKNTIEIFDFGLRKAQQSTGGTLESLEQRLKKFQEALGHLLYDTLKEKLQDKTKEIYARAHDFFIKEYRNLKKIIEKITAEMSDWEIDVLRLADEIETYIDAEGGQVTLSMINKEFVSNKKKSKQLVREAIVYLVETERLHAYLVKTSPNARKRAIIFRKREVNIHDGIQDWEPMDIGKLRHKLGIYN